MSQKVPTVTFLKGPILHLFDICSSWKKQQRSSTLTHSNLLTWKHLNPYQQRLCRCQWWQQLRHLGRLQRHPVPAPTPSSDHRREHWEPWVGSAEWSLHCSCRPAFPPKYIRTDHLNEEKTSQPGWTDGITDPQRSLLLNKVCLISITDLSCRNWPRPQ